MALRKIITLSGKSRVEENGLSVNIPFNVQETTYIKVEKVTGDKSLVTADVSWTGDSVRRRRTYGFAPNLSGANFLAQAYEHLKTLPEFAGATDC
jgi:hypothetical protein